MGIHGQEAWRRRFSADREAIEARRLAGLRQARPLMRVAAPVGGGDAT